MILPRRRIKFRLRAAVIPFSILFYYLRFERNPSLSFFLIKDIRSSRSCARERALKRTGNGSSEIESMHQECSGHIHPCSESRDITLARSSFSGKRCFFPRQMRERTSTRDMLDSWISIGTYDDILGRDFSDESLRFQ